MIINRSPIDHVKKGMQVDRLRRPATEVGDAGQNREKNKTKEESRKNVAETNTKKWENKREQ